VRHVVLDGRQHAVEVAYELQRVADVRIRPVVLPDKAIQPAVQRSLCRQKVAISSALQMNAATLPAFATQVGTRRP
jgi:hypothetical protein